MFKLLMILYHTSFILSYKLHREDRARQEIRHKNTFQNKMTNSDSMSVNLNALRFGLAGLLQLNSTQSICTSVHFSDQVLFKSSPLLSGVTLGPQHLESAHV